MTGEVQATIQATGPKALLAYLRDHPEARFERPKMIADRFAVTESFVVSVLEKAEPQKSRQSQRGQVFYNWLYQAKKRLRVIRDDAAKHPTTFVVASSIFAELILVIVWLAGGKSSFNVDVRLNQVNLFGNATVVPLAAVLLQMSLFFRKGMVRFSLYGAAAFFIVGAVPLGLLAWTTSPYHDKAERTGEAVLMVALHLLISLVYAVVGAIASFLGEYRRILRENRRVERMSRQELLERLFQLEARMESARNEPQRQVRFSKLTTFFKPRLLISAAVAGFVFRLVANKISGPHLATFLQIKHGTVTDAIPLGLSGWVGLLSCCAVVLLAYIAPSIALSISVGLLYAFGELVAQLIFFPATRNFHSMTYLTYLGSTVIIPLRTVFLAVLAGIGAAIQTKTLEELNLQRNDEASLVAEQLKIQWRLAEHSCSSTVMVVDVVRSTAMKEGEAALEIEYSFTKFQQWIRDISESHGGTVTSTAGDGAVISFASCHNAFLAATEIQRRMPAFNQNWNRLTTRFRVRIGLHMGEVQGDLGKVQFAQVIDIAAHLQKVAPAGGVAVTAEVVATLGEEAFVPLAVKSDGHDVYLALNPSGL